MDFVITRTSDCDEIDIQHFDTIEDVTDFVSTQGGRIVMQNNYFHNPEFISTHYDINMDLAKRMCEAEFLIEIYDDYRE